jgi:hypothetical protein
MVHERPGAGGRAFTYYGVDSNVPGSLSKKELHQRCEDVGIQTGKQSNAVLAGLLTSYGKQGGATPFEVSQNHIQQYSDRYVRRASLWSYRPGNTASRGRRKRQEADVQADVQCEYTFIPLNRGTLRLFRDGKNTSIKKAPIGFSHCKERINELIKETTTRTSKRLKSTTVGF